MLNRWVLQHLDNLRQSGLDVRILMHLPPDKPAPMALARFPHHFVTTPEIRCPDYPAKSAGQPWSIWRGGHTDLIGLHFFRANRDFDRYWFVEYDVRLSGRWADFFQAFEASDADFLSTTVRRSSDYPDWMHWRSLRTPRDERAPSPSEQLCSFMPIIRMSRVALAAVDQAYRAGWGGHCEVTWPTIVLRAGLRVEDFGGDGEFVGVGNRNRFYTNKPGNADHAPGSMVFRPARIAPGRQPGMLWHPVKPPHYKFREDLRHAAKAVRQACREWIGPRVVTK
jgi:hypothetical protein